MAQATKQPASTSEPRNSQLHRGPPSLACSDAPQAIIHGLNPIVNLRSSSRRFFDIEELLAHSLFFVRDTFSLTNLAEGNSTFRRIIKGTLALNNEIRNNRAKRVHRLLKKGSGLPIFDQCNRFTNRFSFGARRRPRYRKVSRVAVIYIELDYGIDTRKLKELKPIEIGFWGGAVAVAPGCYLLIVLRAHDVVPERGVILSGSSMAARRWSRLSDQ